MGPLYPQPSARARSFSRATALAVVLIGASVLVGWVGDVPLLVAIPSTGPTTFPNTAAGLILAGTSLLLLTPARRSGVSSPSPHRRRVATALGAVVLLLGSLTLIEYLWGLDLGIDHVLHRTHPGDGVAFAGRPSHHSALMLVLAGAAVLALEVETRRGRRPSDVLALAVAALSLLTLGAHAHRVSLLYRIEPHEGIGLSASLAFLALSLAILTARPSGALVRVAMSDGSGGRLARVMAPLIVLLPLAPLAFTAYVIPRYEELGEIVIGVVSMFLVGTLLWFTASSMNRAAETERRKADDERRHREALDRSNARLQEALHREQEAAGLLRDLNEIKNALIEAVSHDLSTPLAAVRGTAEILGHHDSEISGRKRHELLDGIVSNARRSERLLSSLLDLERLSRGVPVARGRRTDVADLAVRTVDELGVRDHPVEIEGAGVAEVDPLLLERIVENLVMNAAGHTEAGTPIRVSILSEEGGVLLAVEDRGPGVPDHLKTVIFEPFRRGDAPGNVKGNGIGLHLVARFAEHLGGRAWVEDQPEGGASFRVLLPCGSDPEGDAGPRRRRDRPRAATGA